MTFRSAGAIAVPGDSAGVIILALGERAPVGVGAVACGNDRAVISLVSLAGFSAIQVIRLIW